MNEKQGVNMKRKIKLLVVMLIMLCAFSACDSSDAEIIDWGNLYLGKLLPAPSSNKMEIFCNDEERLDVYVEKVSMNDFLVYTNQCEENGFSVEADRSGSSSFEAYNSDGYWLYLIYNEDDDILNVMLSAPEKFGDLQWPTNIESILPAPASKIGKISYNNESGLYVCVGETPPDAFKEYISACRAAGFTIDEYEDDDYFSADNTSGCELTIYYEGFNTIEISLSYPKNFKIPTADETNETNETSETNETIPDGMLALPYSSYAYLWTDYTEIVEDFEEAGFTNITTIPLGDLTDDDWFTFENEYDEITVAGETSFSKGDIYPADVEIVITYHTYAEEQPTGSSAVVTEKDTSTDDTAKVEEKEGATLTIESCSDLATLVTLKDPCDPFVKTFASKYSGRYIEFDGAIYAMQNHKDYNTRFDILINPCDFDPNSCSGPNFRFTDVNAFDMGILTLFLEDVLQVGTDVHVIAKVGEYNADTSLFELKPITVTVRN